jgi:hypothetical protein
MANLTGPRRERPVSLKQIKRVLKSAEVAHEGGLACIDKADGSLVRGKPGTTLVPIGMFIDVGPTGLTGDGTKTVRVRLFKEVWAWWFANDTGTPVTDANFGEECYVLDDQTVTGLATGASKAGRVWGVDSAKGVLVEPVIDAAAV